MRYQKFLLRYLVLLFLPIPLLAQKIPVYEPRFTPFASIKSGISRVSLVPGDNLILQSGAGGWSSTDTLRMYEVMMDMEILRYRWLDLIWQHPEFNASSRLGWRYLYFPWSCNLPNAYPNAFEINDRRFTGFVFQPRIREFYLDHVLDYNYSERGSLSAIIGTGFSNLTLYSNSSGINVISSNGISFRLGAGWRYTLFGRRGSRLRLGAQIDYTFRSYNIGEQPDDIVLPGNSSDLLTPIEQISLSSPTLSLDLEFGELLLSGFTPYRDPYRLSLGTFGTGLGYVFLETGTSLIYDSLGTAISPAFWTKVSQQYDIQLFRYNWLYHLINNADADFTSGIGIRFWKSLGETSLPTDWARDFTNGSINYENMRFSPRFREIHLDHELIYPLSKNLTFHLNGGNGYASLTLYRNALEQHIIESNTFTWNLGGGFGYTIFGDAGSKINFGLSLGYYGQRFDIDSDQGNLSPLDETISEITPLRTIDLSQFVFSVSMGLIFGGNSNTAYDAHKEFVKGNYSKAMDLHEELLLLNPKHHNRRAIRDELEAIHDSLITSYYADTQKELKQGNIEKAYSLIQIGETPPNEVVENAVQQMQNNIAYQALQRASTSLKNFDFEQAEHWISLALEANPETESIATILLARSFIVRATILYRAKVYERSLSWLEQAATLTNRYDEVIEKMRKKIAEGKLDDANAGILKEDRIMVYDSMQKAKQLNPLLAEIVDDHLKGLEKSIRYEDEKLIGPLKEMALDNFLGDVSGLDPDNFHPQVGMKASLIARYSGPPHRRFQEKEYELWVYKRPGEADYWLYLQNGIVEKIERKD